MARRSLPPTKQSATLSPDEMHKGIVRIQKRLADISRLEPEALNSSDEARAITSALSASIDDILVRTFGTDTVEYERFSPAKNFTWPIYVGGTPIREIRNGVQSSKVRSHALLSQAAETLRERLEEIGASQSSAAIVPPKPSSDNRRIFVVHGHDVGARQSLVRFLEHAGFEPIVLHEQANRGKTIIEKFEANADAGFAVALLTPDDVGGVDADKLNPRARQNVVLELGYFIGRLGRDRVCALMSGNVELPSDILGIVWIEFDALGAWKSSMAKELEAADYQVDWNRVMRS